MLKLEGKKKLYECKQQEKGTQEICSLAITHVNQTSATKLEKDHTLRGGDF